MASGEEVEALSDSEEISETEAIGDDSSTSSGKFCSDVWNHFSKCAARKKAICKLCNKEYAYLGMTSYLRDYLQRFHKDKYKAKEISDSQRNKMDSYVSRAKCPTTRGKKITVNFLNGSERFAFCCNSRR